MSRRAPHPTRRDVLRITAGSLGVAAVGSTLVGCGESGEEASSPLLDTPEEKQGMTQKPLHYETLSEVATKIAQGDLDSVQVTQALLARIDRLEPKLHSYITVMGEQALERARAADALRDQGKALGVLHGVPIAVKDLCHKRGYPTTCGHSFRKDLISDSDATVVARLEAAGAIILGKLATT